MSGEKLRLMCLVWPDEKPDNHIVEVKIDNDETVVALKDMIKDKHAHSLRSVDARDLVLWKCSIPDDKHLKETLNAIHFDGTDPSVERLVPLTLPLSEHFKFEVDLSQRTIHVLVEVPVLEHLQSESKPTEEYAHMKAVDMARTAPSPSSISKDANKFKIEQDKRPIYNGRPAVRRGPPVTIYHTAFAKLKDALGDLTRVVDKDEVGRVDDTAKLFLAATNIYPDEDQRSKAIIPHLKNLLGIDIIEKPKVGNGRKDSEPDAIATGAIQDASFGKKIAVIGYVEFKNEFGIGGDCGVQNALGLRKYLAQEKYKEIRNSSCCPCIMISVAGPYISFGGAILVDAFTVESFTDYIYLGGNPFAQERIIQLARIFVVLSQALLSLKRFYQELKLKPTPDLPRLFPCPTYFSDRMPQTKLTFTARFNYEGRESDDYRRSLFRGTYGDKEVLIKFCARYGGDGHRIVAEKRHAPELFFCEQIQGGVTMVIMKFIAGQDAYYRFKNFDLPPSILDDVKSAIEVLHGVGLVFGDLRRPNIIIDKLTGQERALLIDFEWVGQDGQARYPALLNDSGVIRWANGVQPHAIMKQEHDLEMINKLNIY